MAANTNHTPYVETNFECDDGFINLLPSIMEARSMVSEYSPRTLKNAAPRLPGAEQTHAATGWDLVDTLKWHTVSDLVITEAATRANFEKLSGAEVRGLRTFLRAREDELTSAAPYYLEIYDQKTRLQFVALGRDWFETLMHTPTIASYLQNECQDIDLVAILYE
jgi:hypothetical protein